MLISMVKWEHNGHFSWTLTFHLWSLSLVVPQFKTHSVYSFFNWPFCKLIIRGFPTRHTRTMEWHSHIVAQACSILPHPQVSTDNTLKKKGQIKKAFKSMIRTTYRTGKHWRKRLINMFKIWSKWSPQPIIANLHYCYWNAGAYGKQLVWVFWFGPPWASGWA